MIHSCYGSGCEWERSDGECSAPRWVVRCPADERAEEPEDAEDAEEDEG